MSLRTKFLLALVLVSLLGVGTVAWVAYRVITHEFVLYVTAGGVRRAERLAATAADYYAQTGSWTGVEDLLTFTPGGMMGRGRGPAADRVDSQYDRVLIVDPDGEIVADTGDELVGKSLPASGNLPGTPIVVNGVQVGTLVLTTNDLSGQSDLEARFLETVNRAVLWAVLPVALAALLAAALLSRQLVAPLRELTMAAERLAQGDLTQQVVVHTSDEVGELGRAFNRMANDLHAAAVQRQQMTADIAHELRNPLSILRGNLEAMLDGIYPADKEHLQPIYEEALLLQRLVNDLRLLSLADTGQLPLVRQNLDLGELVAGIAESSSPAADGQAVALHVAVPPEPVVTYADADRLRQVIGNLINNALRYTPSGGTIALAVQRVAERVEIAVSDTGPGIAPQDLAHVFDRFYRAGAARDRTSGGSGLGLAIARALTEAHGGTLTVTSTPGTGATFVISLPAA